MRVLAGRKGLLAFLAGGLAAAGQAPLSLWPLALAGFAALFHLVVSADTPRAAARRAWLFGGGYFMLALSWIVEPFLVDIARHGWMAPFALALMGFGLALFWGAAAWAAARLRLGGLGLAVTLGMAELARSYVFTGFPWALIGHLWIGTPVMQLSALGGPHLLTFLTLLLVALPLASGRAGALVALALLAGSFAAGLHRLAQPVPPQTETAPTIRLLQPNAAQHLKWRPDMVPVFFDRQLEFTRQPPRPDAVIWPETAVPVMLERPGSVLALMAEASQGTPVLFGIQRRDAQGTRNSLAVMDATGAIVQVYDKHHLVPFGEYMPLQPLFGRLGIAGLAANDVFGYAAGPGPQVLDLGPLGKALPLICYEAVFPNDLRAGQRPDWLLQITNDAWFGRLSGPYQHLAQARLRAVEQGVPMLRSANTGVSAVIDARGRVLDSLPLNTAGVLDVTLPAPLPPTVYARSGDWPMAMLYLLSAALLFTFLRRTNS